MDTELVRLEQRVAALEEALAVLSTQSQEAKRSARKHSALISLAVIVAASAAVTLAAGSSSATQAGGRGPTKVTAPFLVQDSAGKTLVSVNANETTGFGTLYVFGRDVPAMKLTADATGDGIIDLLHENNAFVTLGVSGEHGLIRVTGSRGRSAFLAGQGELFMINSQGKRVATLQVDGRDQGDLHLRDRSGADMIGLFVTPSSSGIAQLNRSAGDTAVEMGTKEGGKGDVCVNGPKGNLCMALLAVKALIPY